MENNKSGENAKTFLESKDKRGKKDDDDDDDDKKKKPDKDKQNGNHKSSGGTENGRGQTNGGGKNNDKNGDTKGGGAAENSNLNNDSAPPIDSNAPKSPNVTKKKERKSNSILLSDTSAKRSKDKGDNAHHKHGNADTAERKKKEAKSVKYAKDGEKAKHQHGEEEEEDEDDDDDDEEEDSEESDSEEEEDDDDDDDDEEKRKNNDINKEQSRKKEQHEPFELLNLDSSKTIQFYTLLSGKHKEKDDNSSSSRTERYRRTNLKKEKKLKMSHTYEEFLWDHHDYTLLKVNYKINKKSHYDKSKKRAHMPIFIGEKKERTLNKSSICTDNAKFLNFLKDNEKNAYYYNNRKRYESRRRKQIKTNIKIKEKSETKETLDNYIINVNEKNKYNEIMSSENIDKFTMPQKQYPATKETDEAYVSELQDAEQKEEMKEEERQKNYASTVEEEKKIIKEKSKVKSCLRCNRRFFIFPQKTLRRRKEKIIIFLNHNYSARENGQFNDHFYKTIHKNDLDNLEEERIYIDNDNENTIKKIIYRIFPQFSIFSLILFVTFIQWVIFILLISIKSDFTLTPSNDSLKNFGSNFPHNIFKKAEFYRLFTALFLHSNFNHICANTYVQLTVGFLLEYLYGTYVVFLVYVFTGIYGIILSSPLTYCYSTTESSSSSSGIIGIFFSEILMMTNFNVDKISISVHLFCFFLLLLFLKFSLNTVSINIYSHFFGFLGGFLIGIILKRNQLKYFLKNNLLIQILSLVFLIIKKLTMCLFYAFLNRICFNVNSLFVSLVFKIMIIYLSTFFVLTLQSFARRNL
ncbi:hypothetical protein AK88_04901 [Plasmodium fragile]|uniref:Rhomboid-like protease n=1 Tax=Plasmodium fragile TaxID=5857 RepID=A0A0D9QF53_PLAFR|nr:uncharacterized protein AK88_04901 [Plasmodium fragile]KJP85462.1 hypothetical protein AK88_04901 [Plasmodium fragile]